MGSATVTFICGRRGSGRAFAFALSVFFLRLFPRLLAVLTASRSELGVVRPFVVIFSDK